MEVADAATTRMVEDVLKGNEHAQDDRLMVRFYMGAMPNEEKSLKEGRPIFDNVEFVSIAVPGQLDRVDRPVWDGDRRRFAKKYEAWKQGAEAVESGTPLSAWPFLQANQVAEFNARNVRTVEQLAQMADIDINKFMGGISLRQRARDFIEEAKGKAPLLAMRAELESRDQEIAAMKAQMAEMAAAMKAAEKKPK